MTWTKMSDTYYESLYYDVWFQYGSWLASFYLYSPFPNVFNTPEEAMAFCERWSRDPWAQVRGVPVRRRKKMPEPGSNRRVHLIRIGDRHINLNRVAFFRVVHDPEKRVQVIFSDVDDSEDFAITDPPAVEAVVEWLRSNSEVIIE